MSAEDERTGNMLGNRSLFIQMCVLKRLGIRIQSTPDNWNLQGKLKKVRVIGSSSYRG